ncbi:MAG: TIGR03086 family protein [Chloroflexi bacterium]|nr:TIGR03086 family protein [Chloroflexota bacterium]
MTSQTPTMGELYVRAMRSAARFVSGVPEGAWHDPTPCTEWDLRVLVNHITYENLWAAELFPGKTMAEVGDRFEGDVLGDDPIGAFNRSVEAATAAVSAPGAMEAVTHLSFGDTPGSEYAKQLFGDMLIHGWDVAKASRQDAALDAALVDMGLPLAEEVASLPEGNGAFAARVPVPGDAPAQTRLLALMGRRADWAPA